MRQHGPALQKTSFVQIDEDTAGIQLWMQQKISVVPTPDSRLSFWLILRVCTKIRQGKYLASGKLY